MSQNVMTQLAAQTVKTGLHTGQIKDGVTSAGGTTIAGVEALERGAFRGGHHVCIYETDKKLGPVGP